MGDKEAIKTSFCFLGMPLFFDLIESFSILVIGASANLNTGTQAFKMIKSPVLVFGWIQVKQIFYSKNG